MKKHKALKNIIYANLIMLVGYQLFVPFYALFAKDIGATVSQTGLIWSFYSLTTAFVMFFVGKLENNLNKNKIVVYGFFMYSAAAFAFLLVDSLTELIIVFGINAFVGGFTIPAYKTLFTKLQDKGRESEEWSWLESGNMIAVAIGSAVGGVILAIFGFNGIFIAMGILQLVAAIILKTSLQTKINIETDLLRAKEIALKTIGD